MGKNDEKGKNIVSEDNWLSRNVAQTPNLQCDWLQTWNRI